MAAGAPTPQGVIQWADLCLPHVSTCRPFGLGLQPVDAFRSSPAARSAGPYFAPRTPVMYEEFYGLGGRPFDLTPDPRFLLLTPKHREALSLVQYLLSGGPGLALLIGEAGTGKTTLLRAALQHPRRDGDCVVTLDNPTLTRDEFFEFLGDGFHLGGTAGGSKTRVLRELTQALTERGRAGAVSVLVVDEAQRLSNEQHAHRSRPAPFGQGLGQLAQHPRLRAAGRPAEMEPVAQELEEFVAREGRIVQGDDAVPVAPRMLEGRPQQRGLARARLPDEQRQARAAREEVLHEAERLAVLRREQKESGVRGQVERTTPQAIELLVHDWSPRCKVRSSRPRGRRRPERVNWLQSEAEGPAGRDMWKTQVCPLDDSLWRRRAGRHSDRS